MAEQQRQRTTTTRDNAAAAVREFNAELVKAMAAKLTGTVIVEVFLRDGGIPVPAKLTHTRSIDA